MASVARVTFVRSRPVANTRFATTGDGDSGFRTPQGKASRRVLGSSGAQRDDRVSEAATERGQRVVQAEMASIFAGDSIILTGSSAGTTGAPAMSAYSASKAAVRNVARTWAEDLKGTGIQVNVLTPGRRRPTSRRKR